MMSVNSQSIISRACAQCSYFVIKSQFSDALIFINIQIDDATIFGMHFNKVILFDVLVNYYSLRKRNVYKQLSVRF